MEVHKKQRDAIEIVLEELQRSSQPKKKDKILWRVFPRKSQFPSWMFLVLVAAIVLGYFGSYWTLVNFPKPLKLADELDHPRDFIAENAYDHTYRLAEIGYRVTGTPNNEVFAVQYLWDVINEITRSKSPDVDIEVQHDISSGVFKRDTIYTMTNNYRGLQNIVVLLTPKNVNASLNYILLNAHFDTVPFCPGAADDAQMVGVMLELLRVLSRARVLSHGVVFLFNGSEENGLAATHAFIMNNKWASKIGVLVNLEGAGGGAKETLFQVKPEYVWLAEAYKDSIQHPFSTVISEELYNLKLLQSDTDYTNFKNYYDRLPAMGFAQSRDGYTYHTQYDDIGTVNLGSLQNTGENMLNLVKKLDEQQEMDNYLASADQQDPVIYYDFLGVMVLMYSTLSSSVTTYVFAVAVLVLCLVRAYEIKRYQHLTLAQVILELVAAHVVQVVSNVLGVLLMLGIGAALDALDRPLSWYSHPWLIYGLYLNSYILVNCLIPALYVKLRRSKVLRKPIVEFHIYSQANIIAVLALVMNANEIKSTYILQLILGFFIVAALVIIIFRAKSAYWMLLYGVLQILPSMYIFYLLNFFLMTLIPAAARSYNGATFNPETRIVIFAAIGTFLGMAFYTPLLTIFKRKTWILCILGLISVISIIVALTPVGFPFRIRTSPQRFTVWHVKRELYDYNGDLRRGDSGYYVYGYDRLGVRTLFDHVDRMKDGFIPTKDCEEFIACAQPWFRPQYRGNLRHNYFIPAEAPLIPTPAPTFKILAEEKLSETRTNYSFAIAGPHFQMIHLSPLPGVKIVDWSFLPERPLTGRWNGREYFVVNYVHGVADWYMVDQEWWMVVETPENWTEPYSFDLGHAALFVHDESTKTPEFIEFTNSFPEWTNVQNWTATYNAWQLPKSCCLLPTL